MKKITIEINEEMYKKLEKLVDYQNMKNELRKNGNEELTIEDFILGSTITMLEFLNDYMSITPKSKIKNNIKAIMEVKRMKAVELVAITNIEQSNMSQILSNRSQPSLDSFIRIWIALGMPLISDMVYWKHDKK